MTQNQMLFVLTVLVVLHPVGARTQPGQGGTPTNNSIALSWAELPPGQARTFVQERCTQCHGLQVITSRRMDVKEWAASVARMRAEGAEITETEARIVARYLTAAFGPEAPPVVDVNAASKELLEKLPGVDGEMATAIIAFREACGPMQEKSDLLRIPEFKASLLESISPYIVLGSSVAKDQAGDRQSRATAKPNKCKGD